MPYELLQAPGSAAGLAHGRHGSPTDCQGQVTTAMVGTPRPFLPAGAQGYLCCCAWPPVPIGPSVVACMGCVPMYVCMYVHTYIVWSRCQWILPCSPQRMAATASGAVWGVAARGDGPAYALLRIDRLRPRHHRTPECLQRVPWTLAPNPNNMMVPARRGTLAARPTGRRALVAAALLSRTRSQEVKPAPI